MSGALGIGVGIKSNKGLSAEDHRQIIDAMWMNTGVVKGCSVSGRADLSYQVAAGVAVCQRLAEDGKTVAVWPGGGSPAVPAGDAAHPRIDCVYVVAHNENDFGDADNLTTLGVAVGTPAASPSNPSVPAGATPLRYMRLPANATSTQTATPVGSIEYAIPYGANLGMLARSQVTNSFELGHSSGWVSKIKTTINLPTDRSLRLCAYMNFHAKGTNGGNDTRYVSEIALQFRIDGKQVGHLFNFPSYGSWTSHQGESTINCTQGTHTVEVLLFNRYGNPAIFHYSDDGNQWAGVILEVHDNGPSI